MAKVFFYRPLDGVGGLTDLIDGFDDPTGLSKSSNKFKVRFGDDSITFGGSNFEFKNNLPVSGTVKSVAVRADGDKVFEAKSLKISVSELAAIARSGDYDDVVKVVEQALDGKDYIHGSAGGDVLQGFGGDDRFYGRGGNDTLTGGKGKDVFFFTTKLDAETNVDTITDFSHKFDTIKLGGSFKGLSDGKLSSKAFKVIEDLGSATDKSDRILYDKADGDLYFDRDGSGAKYDPVKFAEVKNNATVDHTDFLIV